CFVNSINPYGDQLLFSYGIPDATSLNSGNNYYTSYSREEVPLGSQKAVTGYWAPENSIYSEGILSIVGVYNNNNALFGYTLINVGGFINQEGCSETGVVELGHFETTNYQISSYLTQCNGISFVMLNDNYNPTSPQECPVVGKSVSATEGNVSDIENLWQFKGIDAQGIHATLFSESNNTRYEVVVYDMMGRKITSSSYNVSGGQQEIYLEFAVKAEMYILKVSNGKYTETLKIVSNN
ncbi:MAG: T9SS type A sorting domain-containing protein, partial [Bacteroidales bacterium]